MEISSALKKTIESSHLVISSVNSVGAPHSIAVAFVKVLDKNKLLVTDNFMKNTIKNIQANSAVSVVVVKGWDGFEILGKAKYFSTGKYLDLVKQMPSSKGFPSKGALVITVNTIKEMA